MRVWNITCECGYDLDHPTLAEARRQGRKHLTHNEDGAVYLDQVNTNPAEFEDYQTGKSIKLTNNMETPKNPAAVALGSMKSDKKTAAARKNGKKGGRPKRFRHEGTRYLPVHPIHRGEVKNE